MLSIYAIVINDISFRFRSLEQFTNMNPAGTLFALLSYHLNAVYSQLNTYQKFFPQHILISVAIYIIL